MTRTPPVLRVLCVCVLVTLGLFSCSRSSGANNSLSGSSLKSPLPGSIVGNWIIDRIAVVQDTGARHRLRNGMNIRVSPTQVEVLADVYVGPGTLLPKVMDQFYHGELEFSQSVKPGRFELAMVLDYSAAFALKRRNWYTRITAQGVLNEELRVDLLIQNYWPDPQLGVVEQGRDELVLFCKAGGDVPELMGDWAVRDIIVLHDSGQRHPIRVGQKLETEKGAVLRMFGSPFTADEFHRVFPNFEILNLMSIVGNGVAQGFIAFRGRPPLQGTGAVGEFNFYHTGKFLQGELRMVWTHQLGQEVDHLYLVMTSSEEELAARADGGWLLMDRAEFARLRATGTREELHEK